MTHIIRQPVILKCIDIFFRHCQVLIFFTILGPALGRTHIVYHGLGILINRYSDMGGRIDTYSLDMDHRGSAERNASQLWLLAS